jgi:hypothetical protein
MHNGKQMLAACSAGLLVVGLYVASQRAWVFGLDDNPGTDHKGRFSRESKGATFVPGANRSGPVNFSLLSDRLKDPSNGRAHPREKHPFPDNSGVANPDTTGQGFGNPGQAQIGQIPTASFGGGSPITGGSPIGIPPILSGPANTSGPVNVPPVTGDPPIVGDPRNGIPDVPVDGPRIDPLIVGDPAVVHTPEPETIVLFALGLVLLMWLISRKTGRSLG